jgi:DNA-binding NarL/FixJ family response regulator
MADDAKAVWLIDDVKTAADEYKRFLERSKKLIVGHLTPLPSMQSYGDLINHPQTRAFIIDQRLDKAKVPYEGIQLADHLRSLRPELPIFILTGWPDDVEGRDESVEAIIPKDRVRKHPDVYVARILRCINRYEEALTEKQRRIKELIDLKIADRLSSEAEEELESLRADIERPAGSILAEQEARREAEFKRQAEFLERLEELTQEFRKGLDEG